MQVLDMLEKGLTPPGIKEIDDKPPDPTKVLPAAAMSRKLKPWEEAAAAAAAAVGIDA
jgi:hypothetical protein